MDNAQKELAEYIKKHFILDGYSLMLNKDPTMTQLMSLKGYIENAIWEKMKGSK